MDILVNVFVFYWNFPPAFCQREWHFPSYKCHACQSNPMEFLALFIAFHLVPLWIWKERYWILSRIFFYGQTAWHFPQRMTIFQRFNQWLSPCLCYYYIRELSFLVKPKHTLDVCLEVTVRKSVFRHQSCFSLSNPVHRKPPAHTSDASTRSYHSDCFSTRRPPPALSHSQLQRSFDMSVVVVVIAILFLFLWVPHCKTCSNILFLSASCKSHSTNLFVKICHSGE